MPAPLSISCWTDGCFHHMIRDAVLEAATQSPTAVKSLVWKVPTFLHVSRPSFDASALCGSIEANKVAVSRAKRADCGTAAARLGASIQK